MDCKNCKFKDFEQKFLKEYDEKNRTKYFTNCSKGYSGCKCFTKQVIIENIVETYVEYVNNGVLCG